MATAVIPLQAIPDQTLTVEINGKDCDIHVYTRYRYMYMDLTYDNNILFQGIICQDRNNLIQYSHLGFDGELKFVDTQGTEDPYFSGFEDRWFLVYVQ